jgi:hypothetical protein
MRVYLSTEYADAFVKVSVQKPKPEEWDEYDREYLISNTGTPSRVPVSICRSIMTRLLRGTGKKLPKHGSKEVVAINITAT